MAEEIKKPDIHAKYIGRIQYEFYRRGLILDEVNARKIWNDRFKDWYIKAF